MISRSAWFLSIVVAVAACTQAVQLAPDPLGDLVSIELSPQDSTLTITDLSEPPQTQTYHAIGTFSDGSRRDITEMLAWAVDNGAPGGFLMPGTFSTSNAAAGVVGVTATRDGVVATARITVMVDATVVDAVYPPSDASLFGGTAPVVQGDPTHGPALLYPSDATIFPQGVADTLFQMTIGAGNDAVQLTFDSDVLHLAVLTGADRWDAGAEFQTLLERSSIGEPTTVGISAASSANPGTVYGGPSIAIAYTADQPGGQIYFWSAAQNGIMRGQLGTTSAPKLFPSGADTTCAGCHTATRDGAQLAMDYGSNAETAPVLESISAQTLATTIDHTQGLAGGWIAYSPDGALMLVADDGQLTLRDSASGAPVGGTGSDGKIALPIGHFATHPDWSPDGTTVAIAYTQVAPTTLDVDGASIALLPYNGDGTFGSPMPLVAAVGTDNDYFPKWSPDGRYVAYVHASESSYGAASATLALVAITGGAPIPLGAASAGGGMADTMPAWAPGPIGARAYLAFSSARPYGAVLPTGRSQIWVSAVDLANAQAGPDPSSAAFWLPCQDVTVINNDPVWAVAPPQQ